MRGHPSHEAAAAIVFATLCGWSGASVSRVWVYGGALLPRGLVKGSGSGMGGRSLHLPHCTCSPSGQAGATG